MPFSRASQPLSASQFKTCLPDLFQRPFGYLATAIRQSGELYRVSAGSIMRYLFCRRGHLTHGQPVNPISIRRCVRNTCTVARVSAQPILRLSCIWVPATVSRLGDQSDNGQRVPPCLLVVESKSNVKECVLSYIYLRHSSKLLSFFINLINLESFVFLITFLCSLQSLVIYIRYPKKPIVYSFRHLLHSLISIKHTTIRSP